MRRDFVRSIIDDLRRRHPVAYERVGWVFAKPTRALAEDLLLLPVDYVPVADDDYLPDSGVGASFNATAIRGALQRSRNSGLSCLQIHMHDHHGQTAFSSVDCRTIDKLAGSLRVVAPDVPHGGLVLSQDSATARIWLPEAREHTPSRVVLVGFPMGFGPRS